MAERVAPTPEAVARAYPPLKVPLFPILSVGSFIGSRSLPLPYVLDVGSTLSITSARMGIGVALREMGLRKNEKVLLPSYHCNSMVEPVIWASGQPVFYRVNADASVNFDDVESKIDSQTKVIMITHYFGFPQNIKSFRQLCDERGLILIEDCAHAIFGQYEGRPLGSFGDYTVVSPMKFFPVFDGGWLISSRIAVDRIPQQELDLKFILKAADNILGRSLRFGRLRSLRYLYYPMQRLKASFRRERPGGQQQSEGPSGPAYNAGDYSSGLPGEFDPSWLDKRMSLPSRCLIRLMSKARIVEKRREHYSLLFEELGDVPGARPLFPELPDDVVPYLFPLVVDDPGYLFPRLKNEGMPISRFGEYLSDLMDPQSCPNAVMLSQSVLQFPCHQELRRDELLWIIDKVKQALYASRKLRAV